jgi:hypothetical protein
MSTSYNTFPSTNSIPPACFFNIRGLPDWLNQNPSYKQYFINYPTQFPYLFPMTSTLSSIGYNIERVPLGPFVTTMSQGQSQVYQKQLALFHTVYEFNSNAYVNSLQNQINPTNQTTPCYWQFSTYQDRNEYRSAVSLVDKLYMFRAMADGQNEYGSTLGWVIPFPL